MPDIHTIIKAKRTSLTAQKERLAADYNAVHGALQLLDELDKELAAQRAEELAATLPTPASCESEPSNSSLSSPPS